MRYAISRRAWTVETASPAEELVLLYLADRAGAERTA
jgi:hypothetical protein